MTDGLFFQVFLTVCIVVLQKRGDDCLSPGFLNPQLTLGSLSILLSKVYHNSLIYVN